MNSYKSGWLMIVESVFEMMSAFGIMVCKN